MRTNHLSAKGGLTSFCAHGSRLIIAAVFLFSGFVKAVDPLGTVYKIEDYLKAFATMSGDWVMSLLPLATTAAACLILVECVLGVLLLFDVRTGWTSWLALLFYLVMTPLTLWIALTNPVSDCGCFGDAVVLTNWQTFWKNIVLLALVITLLCTKNRLHTHWSRRAELSFLAGTVIAVLALMGWTQTHLPLIDFRPYKIGNNIPELMEGGKPDVYDYVFIYEKDGVQQEFTADRTPSKEEGWTYIDRKDILVEKGVEAPIHDFELTRLEDGEDITDDILSSAEPVTLIVMYDIRKSDKTLTRKILDLVRANTGKVYILTGSGSEDIGEWLSQPSVTRSDILPQVEQAVCTADPVMLKTIVRANPGVMVVQNGIITDKYNLQNR